MLPISHMKTTLWLNNFLREWFSQGDSSNPNRRIKKPNEKKVYIVKRKTAGFDSTSYKIELEREQLERTKKCSNLNDPPAEEKRKRKFKSLLGCRKYKEGCLRHILRLHKDDHNYFKSSERWGLQAMWIVRLHSAGDNDKNTGEIRIR